VAFAISPSERYAARTAAFALMGIIAIMVLPASVPYVHAQEGQAPSLQGDLAAGNSSSVLAVTGSASEQVLPDRVNLQFRVDATAKAPQDALDSNAAVSNRVIDALGQIGVTENETTTTGFGINPKTTVSQTTGQETLVGYTVSHSLQIVSKNIRNASLWIDTIISAGASNIDSISFTLSDDLVRQTRNVLIEDAMKDARQKAESAAAMEGAEITGVKSIAVNDLQYNAPGSSFSFGAYAGGSGPPAFTPQIHAGEQQVSTTVAVVYSIAETQGRPVSQEREASQIIAASTIGGSTANATDGGAVLVYDGLAIKIVFVPFNATSQQQAWEEVEAIMLPPGYDQGGHYYRAKSIAASQDGIYVFLEVP
jgi:uncharacterized protein YggE